MSGKPAQTQPSTQRTKQKLRKSDARSRRTHQRLGMALLELICQKPIDEVTVQEVLDQASVGRSTFYQHFRDKNDLLLSQLEVFLEIMSTMLCVRREASRRIVPITEMFEHIGGQNRLYHALADSGSLPDFYDLAQDYFTRGIENRLRELKETAKLPATQLRTCAVIWAGGLLSLLRWWIARGGKDSPAEMDELYHRMVWQGMRQN
jgi:AcrR family transcriptional regulator